MQLKNACLDILNQLAGVVRQMDEKDFCKPSKTLSNSTVGQHLRHTVEFFICLEQGFNKGLINYDKREHDKLIESDKFLALAALSQLLHAGRDAKARAAVSGPIVNRSPIGSNAMSGW